jgi:hypothetical protein
MFGSAPEALKPLSGDCRKSDGPYAADSKTMVLRARFRQSSVIAAYRFANRISAVSEVDVGGLMATLIKPNDPMLVAIKAELLHGLPELTGKQINTAAMLALIAVKRLQVGSTTSAENNVPRNTSFPEYHFPTTNIMADH